MAEAEVAEAHRRHLRIRARAPVDQHHLGAGNRLTRPAARLLRRIAVVPELVRAPLEDVEHVRDDYLEVEIRDVLQRLPADYRAAIEHRYVVGLSGAEAAAAMGRSHGSFRALLMRATQAFKREYGGEG